MNGWIGWAACLAALMASALAAAEPDARPNIVVVLADDLRWDELGCVGHPFALTPNIDRVARDGATFENAFATTPLCSPSRASFLTGLYAHKHGIVDNVDRSELSHRLDTFPRRLDAAGYETAYVGKWHMGVDDSPRPGFDHWVSVKGQGSYFNPLLNIDGQEVKAAGYVTDLFNQRAADFIRRPHAGPFLLYIAHKAVHPDLTQLADGSIANPLDTRFEPADRHRDLYSDAPVPRRPNAMKPPLGKPALLRQIGDLPPLGPETATDDETVRNRQRMLAAVDDGVGMLFDALEETGRLDDTVFIFTSDHGYFYGEHGLSFERRLAYEETIRIPLLVRYPPLVRAGSKIDEYVLAVDLAPTLLELGKAEPSPSSHGRSLVPLLGGESPAWRESFLIEYFSDKVFPRVVNLGYDAVRTHRYKYIRYRDLDGMDELYDLERDPYEMANIIGEASAAAVLSDMQAELDRLIDDAQ